MAAPIKRVIKDYNALSQEHIDLINEHFPNGFENENLISFVTPKGQFIKALEIRTGDTIYLFKIDKNMQVDDEEQEGTDAQEPEFENFKGEDGEDGLEDMDDDDDADEPADEPGDDDED